MFKWINLQGVESSKGFVLQRIHRFYYHYEENGKLLKIDIEPGGYEAYTIYLDSFNNWLPPHEKELISEDKKKEIIKNISDVLNFMKINHVFE